MSSTGTYRSLYASFWDDPDARALSHLAYRVLTTLKGTLPSAGIGFVLDDLLAQRCACTEEELAAAYLELERPKQPDGARLGWIVRERGVVWLVNGLRFEPSIRAADRKHRAHVAEWLAQFGGEQSPLQIVRSFRAYYPDWFTNESEPEPTSEPPSRRRSPTPKTSNTRPRLTAKKGSRGAPVNGSDEGAKRGSGQGSRLAQHNTKTVQHTKKTTWLTPYMTAWREQHGTDGVAGQFASALREVEKALGPEECLARWRRYLIDTPLRYASPQTFAAKHPAYAGDAGRGVAIGDDPHRLSATQGVVLT